ncbi:hypothetical protein KKG31_02375 [Patescibacteria group bacterium]|nr:hypothetical protein [Patescibacteria group bacterium]MBU1758016.1 hypothetical protein [Patescibacteria group bacterium]
MTALTTGDRVRMVLYAEDYVGNSVTKTGWFDMQDYPPKPSNITVNIQLENNSQLTDFNVQSPSPNTTILSGYYSSYQSTNGAVWFTYSGQSVIELT